MENASKTASLRALSNLDIWAGIFLVCVKGKNRLSFFYRILDLPSRETRVLLFYVRFQPLNVDMYSEDR